MDDQEASGMQHEVGKDCPDKTPKDTWSNEQEHVLKTWGEEAKGYAWMHNRTARWFNIWDKVITIPAILLPIIIGSSFFTEYTNILAVKITYGILLLILSGITALQTYLEWQKRATQHNEGAIQYQFYADDIEGELALPRSSRSLGFYQRMREKRQTLFTSYPTIINRYEKQYKKRFGKTTIAKPTITDSITEIVINTDEKEVKEADPKIRHDIVKKENRDPQVQFQLDRYLQGSDVV